MKFLGLHTKFHCPLWIRLGVLVCSGLSGALWHLGFHCTRLLSTLAPSSGCVRSRHSRVFFTASGLVSWPIGHHVTHLLPVQHLWGLGKGVLAARFAGSTMEVVHIVVYIFYSDFLQVTVQSATEVCLVVAGVPSGSLYIGFAGRILYSHGSGC